MFDQKNSEMVDIKKYARKITSSIMSASTRKESAFSNGSASRSDESSSPEKLEEQFVEDEQITPQPSPIKFKFGDKFTKKPI